MKILNSECCSHQHTYIYAVQECSSDGGASVDYADLAKLLTSKTRSITDDVTSAGQ